MGTRKTERLKQLLRFLFCNPRRPPCLRAGFSAMINSIAGFDSPHMNGQSGPAFRAVLRGNELHARLVPRTIDATFITEVKGYA